jgi:hypothetical protein
MWLGTRSCGLETRSRTSGDRAHVLDGRIRVLDGQARVLDGWTHLPDSKPDVLDGETHVLRYCLATSVTCPPRSCDQQAERTIRRCRSCNEQRSRSESRSLAPQSSAEDLERARARRYADAR